MSSAALAGQRKDRANESDLFVQQLRMYASLGRKEQQKAETAKARSEAEFMALLSAYFSGTQPKDYRSFLPNPRPSASEAPRQVTSPQLKPVDAAPPVLQTRLISGIVKTALASPPSSKQYRHEVPATTYTDYRSQSNGSVANSPHAPEYEMEYEHRSSISSTVDDNNSDEMPSPIKWNDESGFDVVFQQQSMGMKLGYDAVRKCAVVKECFEGTESKKYKQITNGVSIISVNGQSLCGISLSKIMSRLREAQRPAVIRFEAPQ